MRWAFAAAVLAMLGACPAAADGPFDGRWAWDPSICANERGSSDMIPSDFVGNEITHYESQCTITRLVPIGTMGEAWEASTSCSGEGEVWERDVIYALSRDEVGNRRLLIEIGRDDGAVIVRHACE
jgi:hypothetical protein